MIGRVCAIALAAAVCIPAAAQAASITGISDQNAAVWSPAAEAVAGRIGAPQLRYITAYDVALHAADNPCLVACRRFYELKQWLAKADGQGKQALIAFSDPVGCDGCQPPSRSQYAAGVDAFLGAFPSVGEFSAWNEPNHKHHVSPQLAARYWAILDGSCRASGRFCTVTAGELLDEGEFERYTSEYRDALASEGAAPGVWSIHPYGAVDSGDFVPLQRWIAGRTGGAPVWLTEVGALYCSPHRGLRGVDAAAALGYQNIRAANLVVLLKTLPPTVERTYYYFLAKPAGRQERCPGFDSALIGERNIERPALDTVLGNQPPAGPFSGFAGFDQFSTGNE